MSMGGVNLHPLVFFIHGAVDVFSRQILRLEVNAGNENRHLEGTCDYCGDVRGENMEVEYLLNILLELAM